MQQRARQNARRLMRLVGGNPNLFSQAPAQPRWSESGYIPHQGATLNEAVRRAQAWLLSRQDEDGYWVHELEADTTLNYEYIMLRRLLCLVRLEQQRKSYRLMI